jgi:acetyl/propionyl-CoA carboxylase alpha subunit
VGAGTVEFLLAPDGSYYFLEVNARLQVEHPVTEWVTGIDLVRQQVRIAAGEPLGFTQDEVHRSGCAIESRITAEDPARGFLPATGTVKDLRLPEGPFIRSDFGILPGGQVSVHYDPLIGKLIAWGRTREDARRRLLRAVSELRISGVLTSTHFHVWALQHPAFIAGELHTGFIDQHFTPDLLTTDAHNLRAALVAAAIQAYEDRRKVREPKESASISPWKQGGRRWR